MGTLISSLQNSQLFGSLEDNEERKISVDQQNLQGIFALGLRLANLYNHESVSWDLATCIFANKISDADGYTQISDDEWCTVLYEQKYACNTVTMRFMPVVVIQIFGRETRFQQLG